MLQPVICNDIDRAFKDGITLLGAFPSPMIILGNPFFIQRMVGTSLLEIVEHLSTYSKL